MRKTFDAELQELNYEMIDMAAAAEDAIDVVTESLASGIMRKEEQLLAYLKGACPGRQHAAPGRRLRDILGVSESRLHEMVNHLRQEGYPIGSGRDGYFYIRTFGEARETEEHLARMIRGLEAARQGLLRGMEEKLLSDVGGGCHR